MRAKEKEQLVKIVYNFYEFKSGINGHDSASVANVACDEFERIIKTFDIKKELLQEVENDYTLDEQGIEYFKSIF